MKLAPTAFKSIHSGKKTIEMRLYDEKRAKVMVGDEIEFENTVTHQKIKCIVISLTRYKDFYELYSDVDKIAIGYSANETANAEDIVRILFSRTDKTAWRLGNRNQSNIIFHLAEKNQPKIKSV